MRASQARAEAQRLAEIEKAKNKEGILGYIDRLAGYGASAPFLGVGLGKDIYSTGQAIFGNPEGAAESALDADEYYKRFFDLASKGIKKGAVRRLDSRGVLPREKDLFSYTDPEALEELQSQGMFQYGPQTTGAKPRSFSDGTLDTRFDVEGAGAATQDMIDNLKKDLSEGLPKLPQTLPPSPEMAQFIENVKTDPRGGDKSLEGAAQTLGITEEKLGSMSKKEKESALQKAFVGGVDSYQESLLGKKLKPKFKNEKEEIDYYKKQFADATGIKIDGKPDTKDAMIAFGLALMQNKAGKKFDVGKMLQATGEAGEKAMPLLIKARDKSEAQQLAAGQYALERQIADRDYFRDLEAEEFNRKRELYYALQEAALTGDNEGYTKALEKIKENNIKVGGVDFKIQRGTDETNGRVVFADPTFDTPKVLDAYAKTEAGLESIDQIDSLLDDISQMSKDDPAGQAQFLATSKAKKFLKLIGFDQNNKEDSKYFTADGVLKTDKLDAIQKAIVSRFKRFMTQETGNGISNVDVKMIQAQTGELDFFTDVDSAREKVKQLRFLFTQSKNTLNPIIKELTDRSQYRAGSAGNEQFSKVQNQIEETIFGGRFKDIFEKAVAGEDAQGNTIYNITLADV
jgi:hypothetical protein